MQDTSSSNDCNSHPTCIRRTHVKKLLGIVVVVFAFNFYSSAQKIDMAATVGAYHPVNTYSTSNALAIEGNLGWRVASLPFAALYLEVPVAGTFNASVEGIVTVAGGTTSGNSYS